ncbi:hypothetical protein ACIBG8_08880 [Nonomuraea sp. NPDC050556]|uniref:hypothetical protein n=1 Tax=Nonomuraea sp. NPDC050556 TaxID=3364369 RepID=UPI0037B80B87
MRAEESSLRAEPILATATSRTGWAAGHLTTALAGTTVLMAGTGLGAGLAHGAKVGDMGQVGRVLTGALVQLPAV